MKNIFLDTTQIHSNTGNGGFIVLKDIQGLETPSIRLPSFDRPNVDGAVVPNQLYGGRLITIPGKVYASDISTYRTRRRTLEQACAIKRVGGILYPITLKFLTMDDLALQVEVYTKALSFPDREPLFSNYKLDLFAPTLYLLGQELKAEVIYAFSGGGMAIATGIPLAMNTGASSLSHLANNGNVDAYPTITVRGPLTNPQILNETTGKSLTITHTLSTSAQFIVIDTVNRTAIYYSSPTATGVNVRDEISGDWLTLQPGDNVVKLILATYSADGSIQVNWRDSYSGI